VSNGEICVDPFDLWRTDAESAILENRARAPARWIEISLRFWNLERSARQASMTTLAGHANKRNARRFRLPFDRFWTPSRGIVVSYARQTHSLAAPASTRRARTDGYRAFAVDFSNRPRTLRLRLHRDGDPAPAGPAPVISIEENRNPRARKIRPSIAP
jgi:hypothetical protein